MSTLAFKIDLASIIGKSARLGFTVGTGAGMAAQDVFNLTVRAKTPFDDEVKRNCVRLSACQGTR